MLRFGAFFWYGRMIRPYVFQMRLGTLLLSMDWVIETCWQFFLPIIDYMDASDMWFQKDGATYHTAIETLNLLRTKFPDRIISRNYAVN